MLSSSVTHHRLAAAYAILIPASLVGGLLLAARHLIFLLVGLGGALVCAVLARGGVVSWQRAEGRDEGWGSDFGCLHPRFLRFHAQQGRLPVVPVLALQMVPIVLLAGYWMVLACRVLLGASGWGAGP